MQGETWGRAWTGAWHKLGLVTERCTRNVICTVKRIAIVLLQMLPLLLSLPAPPPVQRMRACSPVWATQWAMHMRCWGEVCGEAD